ncbi:MAG: DUF3991 domain-containing protein [Planctomycetes bacterium]|nr:DUF3991 domain-containing protein [Planctomycetota bacterium]
MLDRKSELDAFKKLNLTVIASSYGYEIVKKKSTKSSVVMSNGADKIVVSQKGQHYIYFSVHDPASQGTVIDFIQQVEPVSNMGQVRQVLRPFLGGGYMSNVEQKYVGRYATEIKPNVTDFQAVAKRYSCFVPIAEPHSYLCDARGIPAELLQSPRILGRIRHDPRRGSVVFPHWGCPDGEGSERRGLVGYELIGQRLKMYSKGGVKALWMSVGMKGDQKLAVAESGLDALSYMAVHGEQGLRVASISGKMNSQQPLLLKSAIERMGQGSEIIAAFDNDAGGDALAEELAALVKEVGRKDLVFCDGRPLARGADWNKVLMDNARKQGPIQSLEIHFGR